MSCNEAPATPVILRPRVEDGRPSAGLPDDDLSRLSPEDRQRVQAWVEDRLINAIAPLYWQLEREARPGASPSRTLAAAHHAVIRVMATVEEARAIARGDDLQRIRLTRSDRQAHRAERPSYHFAVSSETGLPGAML